jgi:hypothetical protein
MPAPARRLALFTGAVALVLIAGCGLLMVAGPRAPEPRSTRAAVHYALTGTSTGASITIRNADGGTEQRDVRVPWESTIRVDRGSFVAVSAQNRTDGTITCTILVDGARLTSSTSEGQYKIASCTGIVP